MKVRALLALASAAVILSACSFESKNERLADDITKAVLANDMSAVMKDTVSGVKITRSEIANASDELNGYGKLQSVKENTTNCRPGFHCFDVKFEKRMVGEWMNLNEDGKVVSWHYHPEN